MAVKLVLLDRMSLKKHGEFLHQFCIKLKAKKSSLLHTNLAGNLNKVEFLKN